VLTSYWPSSLIIHSAVTALIAAQASPLPLPLLSHDTLVSRLIHAVSALEAIDNWEDWLGQRPVQWQ
jgi:hypothetical protein